MHDCASFGILHDFHRCCCCVLNSMIVTSDFNQYTFYQNFCRQFFTLYSSPCQFSETETFIVKMKNIRIIAFDHRKIIIVLSFTIFVSLYVSKMLRGVRQRWHHRNAWEKARYIRFDNRFIRFISSPRNESRKRYNTENICRKAMRRCTGYYSPASIVRR